MSIRRGLDKRGWNLTESRNDGQSTIHGLLENYGQHEILGAAMNISKGIGEERDKKRQITDNSS